MCKLKQIKVILFSLIGAIMVFSMVGAGGEDTKSFRDKTNEEKVKILVEKANHHKSDIAELIRYFEQDWKWEQNWDKEEIQVNFCNLIKEYRAKEAVPLFVRYFDLIAYYGNESPITISNRFVLTTLAQIGMPALEPTTDRIYSELEKLTYSEDTRHRIGFLKDALKYLIVEILGKKLAIAYLEDRISDKDVSPQLKESISSILNKIKQK